MGDISTTITVSAGGAVGEIQDLAAAYRNLAVEADAALEALGKPIETGGLGGLAASMESAAGAVDSAVSSILASLGRLDGAGASAAESLSAVGDAGKGLGEAAAGGGAVADELRGVADTAAGARDGLAGVADAGKAVADSNDAIAGSADPAAAGIRGLGVASADTAATQGDLADAGKAVAETNATVAGSAAAASDALKAQGAVTKETAESLAWMRDTAAITADQNRIYAAGQAEATLGIAKANGVAADSYAALGTTSVEQDAAVAQGIRARKLATEDAAASAEASAGKYHMLALGVAGAVGYGTYLAAQLQSAGTRWYTSAGESLKNVPGDESALLGMSGPAATSQASLEQGEYWTQSAGFHGANAAAVLKPTAEAAFAEGADVSTASAAETTLLNDYFGGPQKSAAQQAKYATEAANASLTAVGLGRMTYQGFAGALPSVLPTAQNAGLSLPQVLGAMATMTAGGATAEWSAQDISHTVGAITGPSGVQRAEQQMLGINPNKLSDSLKTQGLTGVVSEVDSAIKGHEKNGMVVLDTMIQSKLAIQAANQEIAKLPAGLQQVATGYLTGKTTEAQWYALTGTKSTLPVGDVNLLKQFANTANTAKGYSALEKSGAGDKQTVTAALSEALGGKMGEQFALMTGGSHLGTFKSDVDAVGQSVQHTGNNIKGWSQVQDTLNYKLKATEYSLEAVATEAGQALLPSVTKVLGGVSDVLGFAAAHPTATKDVMIGAGLLALPAILSKVASPISTVLSSAGKVGETLGIPGADKLAGIGQGSSTAGAAGLESAGSSLSAAAGSLEGAAGKLSTAAEGGDLGNTDKTLPGTLPSSREPGGTIPAGPVASDAESGIEGDAEKGGGGVLAAAGLRGGTDLAASVNPLAAGVGLGLLIKGLGDQLSPAGTKAGTANKDLQNDPAAAGMMPSIFGGLDSWFATSKFGSAVGTHVSNAVSETVGAFTRAGDYQTGSFDSARHQMASQGDALANSFKGNADWVTSGLDSSRPQAASAVDSIASFFGFGGGKPAAPAPEAAPAVAPVTGGWAGDMLKTDMKLPAADQTVQVKVKPEVDPASANSISETIKHALGTLGTGSAMAPVKVPAPDLSALSAAKAKAATAMASVLGAMKSGAAGTAGIGASMDAGLAGGIAGGVGAVTAAASAVAAAGAEAMHTTLDAHSPSRVTMAIGQDEFDGGFAEGITAGEGTVKKAAEGLSKTAAASLLAGLQGGQSAITTAKDLAEGIAAPFSESTIAGTISTFEADIAKALKKGKISKSEDSGMVAYLKADGAKLQALAQQRQTLENQITQAQSYAQSITAATNQGASIISVAANAQALESGNAPAAVAAPQVSDLISGMQAQVTQTKQFTADLTKLKKEGLNTAFLDQLAQSGAATGDPIAESILGGGKGAIQQLNSLQSQMNTAAKALGVTASNAVYEPAADITKGLAAGLKSQLGAVNSSIGSLSKDITHDLDAALGGGAAAAAFKGGAEIGQEMAAGIASVTGDLTSAILAAIETAEKDAAKKRTKGGDGSSADGISSAVPAAADQHPASAVPHPAAAGSSGGGSGGGGGAAPVVHQTTTHLVVDGQVLSSVVQAHALDRAANNLGTGYQMPGRQY